MITCFIRYEIDPFKTEAFNEYAHSWGQAIPRCGADLIGYYAPHEGSATTAYGLYNIKNLAEYEAYRERLRNDSVGRANYEFAKREQFIRREDRIFLRLASAPHAELLKPWTPFCLSSGDPSLIDLLLAAHDERKHLAGDIALQSSNGVELRMSLRDPLRHIGLCLRISAKADDRDDVQGTVRSSVAAPVEPMPDRLAG
jgi:hypothetical protein